MFLDSPESPADLGKVAHQSRSRKTFRESEGNGTLKLGLCEGQGGLQILREETQLRFLP